MNQPSQLTWYVRPEDRGQIIEVAYASAEGRYVRRTRNTASDPRLATYEALPFDRAQGLFEPWNGAVPQGPWRPV